MSRPLLDWTDPHKTPRSPQQGPACRQDATRPPVASCRPLTGCMADYDALADAVAVYQADYLRADYESLRDAATRCGMPEGDPPLAWATKRLRTYQRALEAA
jgi:hypothetical protein